jgi:hypothetical protein
MKYKIKYVGNEQLKDYAGMNYHAGKVLGFIPKLKKNEILIDKKLSKKDKQKTIRHEIIEDKLIKKGMGYFKAHKIALKYENKKQNSIININKFI